MTLEVEDKVGFARMEAPSIGRWVEFTLGGGSAHVPVVGVPEDAKGEIPRACVVLKPGAKATAADLEAHCRQNLAAYRIPRIIEFLDKVPKTASGKTQRYLLRQRAG